MFLASNKDDQLSDSFGLTDCRRIERFSFHNNTYNRMEHTHIVQAGDLSRYANTRDSQGVIPELVYLLVRQSVPNATTCRIPYGDAVNQPGLDGIVETSDSYFQFVPSGGSYWEIGTGRDPQRKATEDFSKRTKNTDAVERAKTSFVFVTPRSAESGGWGEPEQSEWIRRRQDKGWGQIRVIDGVKLADWMREFPAIGRWMSTKVGITPSLKGIGTPFEHWDLITQQSDVDDPPLPHSLFLNSRENVCVALESLFSGTTRRLFLFAESEYDVDDFVAAYLSGLDGEKAQDYANRCLFINDENAWRSVSELRNPHILVANPRLGLDEIRQDLQTVATSKGHGVVIPLCGAVTGDNPQILKLRSPSESSIADVLQEAKFSKARARELGSIGGGRLSALRRHFLGLGSVPPYATWDSARQLAQAGLAGGWNANSAADVEALAELLGKDYGEWIETLRADVLRSDSPLVQANEIWTIVSRGEAWNSLGNRITDNDLDSFHSMAIEVLSERNPIFDLPIDERFSAALHGKVMEYSAKFRQGLAESLALLGCRGKVLSSCSQGRPERTAKLTVHKLLKNANWERWASLDSLLPLLAEAAPTEFLDAVESVLVDIPSTPFHEIFAQEKAGGIDSANYMTGLLWALEGLAWNENYLARVSLILADIASIDPGGNWANRPANSLTDIFLPWHLQTIAPFERRQAAIQAVLREQPVIGWTLLLALLPHSGGGITSGNRRPVWRDFIPRDWEETTTRKEYWDQINEHLTLAVNLARINTEQLVEISSRLSDLPEFAHESLLSHLSSDAVISLPETQRLPIWEVLDELVRRHRKFAHASWALSEDAIARIETVAKLVMPSSPALKYQHLFSERELDLLGIEDDFELRQKQLQKMRQESLKEILSEGDLNACFKFASTVPSPYKVGVALSEIASPEVEAMILPDQLDSKDDSTSVVVAGFIWTKFHRLKTEWIDSLPTKDWSTEQIAKFLVQLPFSEDTWERVLTYLGPENEGLYWRSVSVSPFGIDRDFTMAIEKLLIYERCGAAVNCSAVSARIPARLNEALATRALISVIESDTKIEELQPHDVIELIGVLQESETADKEALFRIEWSFLSWLGQYSDGSPKTLQYRLATFPAFFLELIRLVYRSENEVEETNESPDVSKRNLTQNAYKLLREWKRCPGIQNDDSLNSEAFSAWVREARSLTEEAGYTDVAQNQIGHVLAYAPSDPNGLWIHETVATTLNGRDTGEMRSGLTTELYNQRGAFMYTKGRAERDLAREGRVKADALDVKGYTRFATAMREFADGYDRQADREEENDPFEL